MSTHEHSRFGDVEKHLLEPDTVSSTLAGIDPHEHGVHPDQLGEDFVDEVIVVDGGPNVHTDATEGIGNTSQAARLKRCVPALLVVS
jgi:hypothetical protein